MAQLIPFVHNPETQIGFRVARTPKGERLEKYRVVGGDWRNPDLEVKVVLRRSDRAMSAAVYNRHGFKFDPCDTETW